MHFGHNRQLTFMLKTNPYQITVMQWSILTPHRFRWQLQATELLNPTLLLFLGIWSAHQDLHGLNTQADQQSTMIGTTSTSETQEGGWILVFEYQRTRLSFKAVPTSSLLPVLGPLCTPPKQEEKRFTIISYSSISLFSKCSIQADPSSSSLT